MLWEEKLRKAGFRDIEDEKGRLHQNAGNSYRTKEETLIEAKRRYHELLGQWQHETAFKDNVERLIMERRANGVKISEISLELKRLGERHGEETIRLILRFYEAKWGIKRKF